MSFVADEVLKDEVLDYIGYSTDCGEEVRNRVDGFIKDAVFRLDGIAGAEVDYNTDRDARVLLKDYCRYLNSHAIELFEENFKTQLGSLHWNYRVKEFQGNEGT